MTAIAACSRSAAARRKIYTRTGLDWTDKFPEIAEAARGAGRAAGAARRRDRRARRQGQYRLLRAPAGDQRGRARAHPVPVRRARDRRRGARRSCPISSASSGSPPCSATGEPPFILYADHIVGKGEQLFEAMCAAGQEGIISKKADAPYRGGRTKNWLKVKCTRRQEFVIIGWTTSDKKGRGFRSLLLGAQRGAASCATPARSAPASRWRSSTSCARSSTSSRRKKAAGRGAARRGARRALGEARAGRRDRLRRVHRRRCRPPRQLPRPARRQAGRRRWSRRSRSRCPAPADGRRQDQQPGPGDLPRRRRSPRASSPIITARSARR